MEQRHYSKEHAGYYREGFLAHGSMSSKATQLGIGAQCPLQFEADTSAFDPLATLGGRFDLSQGPEERVNLRFKQSRKTISVETLIFGES